MRQLLCWLLGHDRLQTGAQRVCRRCGARETRRNYGSVIGWEEVTVNPVRGPRV
jgi:hypothetical protein